MSVQSAQAPFIEYTTTAYTAQTSGASPAVFNKILPVGKWMITGSIRFSGESGVNLPNISVATDIRTLFNSASAVGPLIAQVPVASLYYSDGITPLRIFASATTSTGTFAVSSTIIDCDRILSF